MKIGQLLDFLANDCQAPTSTQNQALPTLLLLYGEMPGIALPRLGEITRRKLLATFRRPNSRATRSAANGD
jgi:hypothetical protein